MLHKTTKYILSICFLLSSLLKSFSIKSFSQEVQLYGDAYIGAWIYDYSFEIAVLICMVEGFIAALLLWNRLEFVCSLLCFAMLLFFVYLTGMNLFLPGMLGSIESCGCFGELIHFTPSTSFMKSLLLLILSIINFYYVVQKKKYKSGITEETENL